ncbi:MAG: ABC transporter ATP-binding protein [Candidatus Omnitrophota bacterium]
MEQPIISVRGIGKRYFIGKPKLKKQKNQFLEKWLLPYRMFRGMGMPFMTSEEKEFWALKDIHFDIYKGERLGVIGRNGAGKTTLLKILSRLVAPTEGEARIRGRVTSLLGVGTGFNSNLTGRENVFLDATLHGLTPAEINEKFDKIVEFSGVGKFIDTPVKFYSSGMHSRLAFSVAAHLEPDILMLDEVLAVGDMEFRKKCLKKVEGMTKEGNTLLFVSHSLGDVLKFCDKVLWLEEGQVRFYGDVIQGAELYQNFMTAMDSIESNEVVVEHRNDRVGTGVAVVNKIGLFDKDMQPIKAAVTGQDLIISINYKCKVDVLSENQRQIACVLYVEDDKGQRLFCMSNKIPRSCNRDLAAREGKFFCRVKRLPLLPGHYNITYNLNVDHDQADKLRQSRSLVVLDGDFYGSGNLPHQNGGAICVDYDWNHRVIAE